MQVGLEGGWGSGLMHLKRIMWVCLEHKDEETSLPRKFLEDKGVHNINWTESLVTKVFAY